MAAGRAAQAPTAAGQGGSALRGFGAWFMLHEL